MDGGSGLVLLGGVFEAEEDKRTGSLNWKQNVRIELEGFENTVDFGILDGVLAGQFERGGNNLETFLYSEASLSRASRASSSSFSSFFSSLSATAILAMDCLRWNERFRAQEEIGMNVD